VFTCVGKTAVAAFALAGLLAACGDDAADTASPKTSSGTETQQATGTAAQELQAAQVKVKEYVAEPTSIRVDTPLKAKPEGGGTFVWMKCDVGQCAQIGTGIKAALRRSAGTTRRSRTSPRTRRCG